MVDNPGSSHGYNIIHVVNDIWVLEIIDHEKLSGTLNEVTRLCVEKLGFRPEDLAEGFEFLANSKEDAMHFGVYKTFIYTFDYDFSGKKEPA